MCSRSCVVSMAKIAILTLERDYYVSNYFTVPFLYICSSTLLSICRLYVICSIVADLTCSILS